MNTLNDKIDYSDKNFLTITPNAIHNLILNLILKLQAHP